MLEVEALAASELHNISFSIGAGEIVGIAGVAGNGQSELLAAIAGMIPMRGSLRVAGHQAAALDVDARRALGLAHLPEDRLGMALIAEFSAEENAILGDQRKPLFTRLACRTGSDYQGGTAAHGRVRRTTALAQGADRNSVGR